MCGRVFNKHLWMKKVSRMIIKKVVGLRSKYNSAVQRGYRSKYTVQVPLQVTE